MTSKAALEEAAQITENANALLLNPSKRRKQGGREVKTDETSLKQVLENVLIAAITIIILVFIFYMIGLFFGDKTIKDVFSIFLCLFIVSTFMTMKKRS